MYKILILFVIFTYSCSGDEMKYNKLSQEEERIIVHKGTEMPFSGELLNNKKKGTYTCKRCDAELYKSEDKFDSHCGWPSFDDEIPGAIKKQTDADGHRTEILCANCDGHLGHVFYGERLTEKNTRHCVNSLSMNFVAEEIDKSKLDTATFAGGCFWGVEFYFTDLDGVVETSVGYTGGHVDNPSYEQVCYENTGHAEALQIVYDPEKITYAKLAKLFFEIHDPTQINRQGPDVGLQYRSSIFYHNEEQKEISERLISILKEKGYDVVTELISASTFYHAEDYHQEYYKKKGSRPYCHFYKKKF